MRSVVLLLSDLQYGFSARQVTLLAGNLPAGRFAARVAVLGREAPWADSLRRAGVRVETLGWTRSVDLRPVVSLRRLLRLVRPDAIHTWDRPSLRVLMLSGGRGRARLVVSRAVPPGRLPAWADRLLLRRADRVFALGDYEAAGYRAAGVPEARLAVGTPAIDASGGESSGSLGEPGDDAASTVGLPAGARVLLGLGPVTGWKGFRDAVWALDILNHTEDVYHLVLVGPAPAALQVARFARAIGVSERVHFVGPVPDLGPWLRRADVVWVPGWRDGGVGAALEAMAAGRPVVASRLPALAEVVADGQTGLLVPPEDKAALARQTLRLLHDPDLGRRLGAAGRRRAAEVFSPGQLVQRCAALYD